MLSTVPGVPQATTMPAWPEGRCCATTDVSRGLPATTCSWNEATSAARKPPAYSCPCAQPMNRSEPFRHNACTDPASFRDQCESRTHRHGLACTGLDRCVCVIWFWRSSLDTR